MGDKERKEMFENAYGNRVKVIAIPDVLDVCHGRKVGWDVRQIQLDKETEAISATNIRKLAKEDGVDSKDLKKIDKDR